MVITTYSQQKMKPIFKDRINRIFNLVKTKATPDLWIKVFVYTNVYHVFEKEPFRNERDNWYQNGKLVRTETDEEMNNRIDKQSGKIRFYFGDRFNFDDIKQVITWESSKTNGHYRYAEVFGHGFYDDEWKFLKKHPKIKHVITLKISINDDDLRIAELIAHEFRHYLQYKKYGTKMTMGHNENGRRKRPIQVEKDAKKWAEKRINKLKEEGKL